MSIELNPTQHRLLAVMLAVALADGALQEEERALVDWVCDALRLGPSARSTVQRMSSGPGFPEEIALVAATPAERKTLFAAAVRMAEADGRVVPSEREAPVASSV
jgi:uncharacterized membrane protein YebE (DUF533 family)